MPGIDDIIGGTYRAVVRILSELMDAAKNGKADACIICRRNKHSDVNKIT